MSGRVRRDSAASESRTEREARAAALPMWDVVGYRRVSTDEQAAEWRQSLAHQTEAITALALKHGRRLEPGAVFEDRFSGESVAGRTGFQTLIAYCRAHPRSADAPGYALFYADSRFGRFADPDEAAAIRFDLKRWGWSVRFATLDDSDDPTTRHLMRAIGGAGASEYLRNLKLNASIGTRKTAAQGLWQGKAPLGYRRAVQPGRGSPPGAEPVLLEWGYRKPEGAVVKLALGPAAEVDAVRWLFASYASGEHTLHALARHMAVRCPGWHWSKQTVRQKLTNPAYVGDVVWCRRPADKDERARTPGGRRPRETWVETPDAHPAIVTRELFAAVDHRLRGFRPSARKTVGGYPLTGLLTCAQCGTPYVGGGGAVNRDGGDPDRYRFYRCGSPDRWSRVDEPPRCPGRIGTVLKRVLEPAVIDAVAAVVADPVLLGAVAAELRTQLASAHAGHAGDVRRAASRVRQLEQEQGRLVDALRTGVMAVDVLKPEADRVRRDLAEARRTLASAQSARRNADRTALEAEIAAAVALAADFRARAAELSGAALREFLRLFVAWGTVDKENRTVTIGIRRLPTTAGGQSAAAASDAGCGARTTGLLHSDAAAHESRPGPATSASAPGAPLAAPRLVGAAGLAERTLTLGTRAPLRLRRHPGPEPEVAHVPA